MSLKPCQTNCFFKAIAEPRKTGNIYIAWLVVFLLLPTGTVRAEKAISSSMVGVTVSANSWKAKLPWLAHREISRSGSAVVVAGQKLLTTANLVSNAKVIQIRKNGKPQNYNAIVARIDYAANLALLSVNEKAFWHGLEPLSISQLPTGLLNFNINRWQDGRFEQGSAEVIRYSQHTSFYDLLLETPALWASTSLQKVLNGEAAIYNNQLVGLAAYKNKNEVRLIPSSLLASFVESFAASTLARGSIFIHRGFDWQALNHPHLQEHFSIPKNGHGVRVNEIFAEGFGSQELQKNDILLDIIGFAIDSEGGIKHPRYGIIPFTVVLNITSSPSIPIKLMRNKQLLTVNVKREKISYTGVNIHPPLRDVQPQYVVFGGLILQELRLDYLQSWGANWKQIAPKRLTLEYLLNSRRRLNQKASRVVIVSEVLSDPINLDYKNAEDVIIQSVNGLEVNSLKDLQQALKVPKNQHHIFSPMPGKNIGLLVFPAAEMEQANQRIAKKYQIPVGTLPQL